MEHEPTILVERAEDVIPEDAPRYSERDFERRFNAAAAALRRKLQARINELEAELASRPLPLPADESMTVEQWEQELGREMSAGEYAEWSGSRVRRTLRQWIASDPRLTTKE